MCPCLTFVNWKGLETGLLREMAGFGLREEISKVSLEHPTTPESKDTMDDMRVRFKKIHTNLKRLPMTNNGTS